MPNRHVWIIVLVAHDDPQIETRVLKERIPVEENVHLAALLRGGELMAVVDFDNETVAEAGRFQVEKSCLR
jgi:hypothetical protein